MPPVFLLPNNFTAPLSCASITFSADTFYRGQVSLQGDSACYPPNYEQVFKTSFYGAQNPSSICPTGWATAATIDGMGLGIPTTNTELIIQCCPSYVVPNTSSAFSGVLTSESRYGVDYNASYARCASSITENILKNVIALSKTTSINLATITVSPVAYADIIQARGEPARPRTGFFSMPSLAISRTTHSASPSASILPSISTNAAVSLYEPSRTFNGASSTRPSSQHDVGIKAGIATGVIVVFLLVAFTTTILLKKREGKGTLTGRLDTPDAEIRPSNGRRLARRPEKGERRGLFKGAELGHKARPH
jgi:hypothetical protein